MRKLRNEIHLLCRKEIPKEWRNDKYKSKVIKKNIQVSKVIWQLNIKVIEEEEKQV